MGKRRVSIPSKYGLGPNDVLISHTLINQASLAAAGINAYKFLWGKEYWPVKEGGWSIGPPKDKSKGPFDAGLFFDLSSLIEAVVLHDHLVTIPTSLDPDRFNLPLRKLLKEEDILRDYDPSSIITSTQVGIDMQTLATLCTSKPTKDHLQQLRWHIKYWKSDSNLWEEPEESDVVLRTSTTFGILDYTTQNYDYCFRKMWSDHSSPVAYYILRTHVYWILSEKLKLSYYPDFTRVPLVFELTNRLNRSLTQEVYHYIAKAFETTVQDLVDSNAPFDVIIPPFAALVLTKCSKPEDIGDVLLDLRKEFSPLRDKFREYEERIRNGRKLGDQRKARKEIIEVAQRLARMYNTSDLRGIQSSLSYLEKGITVGAKPTDLTSYSAELLLKPIEIIREWWIRRRAIQIFRLKGKLDNLKYYDSLIQKVFGRSLYAAEVEEYKRVSKLFEGLLYPKVNLK